MAIVIDFATRRAVRSEPWQQPNIDLPREELAQRRARWKRQMMTLRAARFEWCAINARLYLAAEGSRQHERLRAAYCIAREAWLLSLKELLRTPAPTATALAWKKQHADSSTEVAALMAADETFLATLAPRRRACRQG